MIGAVRTTDSAPANLSKSCDKSSLRYVTIKINGITAEALVDTGAACSLLSKSFSDKLIIPLHATNVSLQSVNQGSIDVFGEITVEVQVESAAVEYTFVVAKIVQSVILGNDFFNKYGALIDYQNDMFALISSVAVKEATNVNIIESIFMTESVIVQPRESKIVKRIANVSCDFKRFKQSSAEREMNLKLQQTGTVNQIVCKNLSSEPKIMRAGMNIGSCLREDAELNLDAEEINKKAECVSVMISNMKFEIGAHLTVLQKTQVVNLLSKYISCFANDKKSLGCCNVDKHDIDTGSAKPINQCPRRLSHAQREKAKEIIDEYEQCGIIRPSRSPWASPIVLVSKKMDRRGSVSTTEK